MTRFILPSFAFSPVFASFALLTSCAPSPCANDNDCATDAVCLIDVDGPRCTAIELAARVRPESATDDARSDGDGEGVDVDDDHAGEGGVVLLDASMSFAPAARAATIVMRPISVVVTRAPTTASASSHSTPEE